MAETEGETHTENSSICWFTFQMTTNANAVSRQKPGAKRFVQVSYSEARGINTWAIFCCFSRPLARSWIGNKACCTETVVHKGTGKTGNSFAYMTSDGPITSLNDVLILQEA